MGLRRTFFPLLPTAHFVVWYVWGLTGGVNGARDKSWREKIDAC